MLGRPALLYVPHCVPLYNDKGGIRIRGKQIVPWLTPDKDCSLLLRLAQIPRAQVVVLHAPDVTE
jgi:hypothetical protein